MREPLRGLGEVGWVPDQEATELAPNAVTDLQNFRMRAGSAEKTHGYRQVFTSAESTPYYLRTLRTATERIVLHCTATKVFADNLNGRFEVTPSGGLTSIETNSWTSAWMNGVLLLCNGILGDEPQYWQGDVGTDLADLPGWDTTWRTRGVGTLKNHWFAMGLRESGVDHPHRLRFSAAVLPGDMGDDWDATDPANDADAIDAPGEGILVGFALPLGDGVVVYKDESCSLVRYTGSSDIWDVQLLAGIPHGMLAPNCGVVVPGQGHAVLTKNGDLIVHDGSSWRSVLDETAKQWLQDHIDTANYARCHVVADHGYSEVQVRFPYDGDTYCTKALLWNWKTGKLGYRDLPNITCGSSGSVDYTTETIDSETVTFDSESILTFDTVGSDLTAEAFSGNVNRTLMAGTGLKIFVMDWSDTADGSSMTGYVEFGAVANLVDQLKGRQQLLTKLWLDVDAAVGATISVYFGAASDPTSSPTYNAAKTFTVGTDRWVDDFVSGPHLFVKLSSTSWFRVRSMYPELEDNGEY